MLIFNALSIYLAKEAGSAGSCAGGSPSSGSNRGGARKLGQAPKTAQGMEVAKRIIIWYRNSQGLPEEVQLEEIEGENLENYLNRICVLFAGTPVPFKADVNLEPTTENKKRKVDPDTVLQYIGRHLTSIRVGVGRNHPDLKGLKTNEFPKWWTAMRARFKEEADRWMINFGGNYEFGCSEVKALYTDLQGRGVDVMSIQTKLLRGARGNNFNIRSMTLINQTSGAFGRGGEGKFQESHEWYWDEYLGVVCTPWRETKTLDFYGMARVFNPRLWGLDFYCIFGMYVMCSNGLWRTKDEVSKGLMNKTMPHLFSIKNERVSVILTEALRSGLPDSMTPQEKKKYSTKSLRGGGITQAANHPQTGFFEVTAASGHSTQTNLDSYLDRKNPLRTIPAVMALQGEPDIHAKVVVPLLDALFAGLAVADKAVVITGVERLLQCMFTINVPDYMAGGKNRVIVEISAASMLFHHPEISKIQGNLVSSTLLNATRTANIQDPRYPHETPAGILSIYSKLIRADFNRRKQESRVQSIASSGGSSAAQWAMVANILDGVHEIKNTVRDVVQEAASQRGTIATLEGHLHSLSSSRDDLKSTLSSTLKENASLKAALHQSQQALHLANPTMYRTPQRAAGGPAGVLARVATPRAGVGSVSRRLESGHEEERGEAPECAVGGSTVGPAVPLCPDETVPGSTGGPAAPLCPDETVPRPSPPSDPSDGATASVSLSYRDLEYSHRARDTSTKKGNKDERLYHVLIAMSMDSQFNDENNLAQFNCPVDWVRNKQLLKNCLEMIGVSIDMLPTEDAAIGQPDLPMNKVGGRTAVKILFDGLTNDVDMSKIKNAAFHLEDIMFKALLVVEGVQERDKRRINRLKRNVIGLGGRVKKYRDSIHEKSGNHGQAQLTPLIPKAEYDKLGDVVHLPPPKKKKRTNSTGGSSDVQTKKAKTTTSQPLSSEPASSTSASAKPASAKPAKAKPAKATTKTKTVSAWAVPVKPPSVKPASAKPASQSFSKAPTNTAAIKNESAKVASKNEVISLLSDDESSGEEDEELPDKGYIPTATCAWEDVATPSQNSITLIWKEKIPFGYNDSGDWPEFGRVVDVGKFITTHPKHAEKLGLLDDESHDTVGLVISRSTLTGIPTYEQGGQYLIGYFDDEGKRRVMALAMKQVQRRYWKEK